MKTSCAVASAYRKICAVKGVPTKIPHDCNQWEHETNLVLKLFHFLQLRYLLNRYFFLNRSMIFLLSPKKQFLVFNHMDFLITKSHSYFLLKLLFSPSDVPWTKPMGRQSWFQKVTPLTWLRPTFPGPLTLFWSSKQASATMTLTSKGTCPFSCINSTRASQETVSTQFGKTCHAHRTRKNFLFC